MLNLRAINYHFGTTDSAVFKRTNLSFDQGEFSLICGPTGAGKSTLLKIINRLVPAFSPGSFTGSIVIGGKEISHLAPNQVAPLIGYVNQHPDSFFVSETVLNEIAFGMEQLGLARAQMQARVNYMAKLIDIEELLDKNLDSLSAGQKQKVAIAAALAAGQKILLLDEPTSSLDAESAKNLLAILRRLASEQGLVILITEHRFERVLPLVDSTVILKGDGSAIKAEPTLLAIRKYFPSWFSQLTPAQLNSRSEIVLDAKDVTVQYPDSSCPAIEQVNLKVSAKEIVSIQGPNGSGKSTLLMALAGHQELLVGTVHASKDIKVVPQNASDLLYLPSVAKELAESDRLASVAANTTSGILESLIGRINTAIHPRDLSAGQQLALVLSIQLAQGSQLIFLDEPTTGLDADSKNALLNQLNQINKRGASILIATHDEKFANQLAHRTLKMQNGKLSILRSGSN